MATKEKPAESEKREHKEKSEASDRREKAERTISTIDRSIDRAKDAVISQVVWKLIYDSTMAKEHSVPEPLKKFFQNTRHRDLSKHTRCVFHTENSPFLSAYKLVLRRAKLGDETVFERVIELLRTHLPLYSPSPNILAKLERFIDSLLPTLDRSSPGYPVRATRFYCVCCALIPFQSLQYVRVLVGKMLRSQTFAKRKNTSKSSRIETPTRKGSTALSGSAGTIPSSTVGSPSLVSPISQSLNSFPASPASPALRPGPKDERRPRRASSSRVLKRGETAPRWLRDGANLKRACACVCIVLLF